MDAGLVQKRFQLIGGAIHLRRILGFDGTAGSLDSLSQTGLVLLGNVFRISGLEDHLLAAVAGGGLGLELCVLGGVALRVAHSAVNVLAAHVARSGDGDLLGLAGVEILCRDVYDAVGVDGERDFDLRNASWRAADAGELEAAELLVLVRHGAFAL